jgi:hypothetical protein
MKHLKNCIKLSCQVKIYVPSTINIKETTNTFEWVNKSLLFLSQKFGGSTASKALGAWVSKSGELIKEDVTLIFSYADQSLLTLYADEIYEFCLSMKNDLKQEAIALEINGELYLI